MKIYYLFFLLILIQLNLVNNQDLNQPTNDNPLNRDFEKDMEELDLSGLEDDIESIFLTKYIMYNILLIILLIILLNKISI